MRALDMEIRSRRPGTIDLKGPDTDALATALATSLKRNQAGSEAVSRGGQLTIIARERSQTAGTCAAEIVTCVVDGGAPMRIYCKFEDRVRRSAPDSQRGLEYEARVYAKLLKRQRARPKFLGAFQNAGTGDTWLFLEYLDEWQPLPSLTDPRPALGRVARWAGRFHALNERRVAREGITILTSFDEPLYREWARRAERAVDRYHRDTDWLRQAVGRCEDVARLLLDQPQTIIHGDLGHENALMRPSGEICAVDWKSAAIGVGEMDLAFLTWGWSKETARVCETEYQRGRWPGGVPGTFRTTLAASRVFLLLRHLGEWPETGKDGRDIRFMRQLKMAAEESGIC